MKKIISIILTVIFVISGVTVLAAESRQVLLCYDADGALVYSKLLKDGEKADIPKEYKDTAKKIYDVSAEEFSTFEEAEKNETYLTRLMSNMPADKNYVISPLSLKIAMMMAANGAEGETQAEILNAFDVDDIDEYNAAAKETIAGFDDEYTDAEVNLANSIWFNKDYCENKSADFSAEYKSVIKDSYFGDYGTVTDKNIVKTLNDWITKQTSGKIRNMVTKENLAPTGKLPLLALVNTVYMKARWQSEFEKSDTKKDIVTDIDGKESKIDFMNKTSHLFYFNNGETQIVELPYENSLSMYVVLGDASNFENDIDDKKIRKVKLSLPKFKTDYFTDFNEVIENMGAKKLFEMNNPDFAPMVTGVTEPVRIETVMQKAIIDVDEKGTEAAVATVVGGAGGSAYRPDEEVFEFKADKPFTYFIRDNRSGEILFAGRYVRVE